MTDQELADKKLEDTHTAIETAENRLRQIGLKYQNIEREVKRLEVKHDNFIEYEKRALLALTTKDKELQKREALLAGTDATLMAQRSNLPKM